LQDVKLLKKVFVTACAAAAGVVLYYLYQRQLGAVSFFLLSIFFFVLAMTQLSKRKKNQALSTPEIGERSEKRRENDR
jgi:membrane protein implicated in regulation of membrane protease activity